MKNAQLIILILLIATAGCAQREEAKKRKIYEDFLATGTVMIIDDTVDVMVGGNLHYVYSFNTGVEDIHYKLDNKIRDNSLIAYNGLEEFTLSAAEVDGGYASGVHVFKAIMPGITEITLYNPYQNNKLYQEDADKEYYSENDVLAEFNQYYSFPVIDSVSGQEKEEIENHISDKSWVASMDSIMDIQMKKYYMHYEIYEQLEKLYEAIGAEEKEKWNSCLDRYEDQLPLHSNLQVYHCYVRIK